MRKVNWSTYHERENVRQEIELRLRSCQVNPLMSSIVYLVLRIGRDISHFHITSYLTELCVCFGDLSITNEGTLWCLPWGIWISLAFNPGHITGNQFTFNISLRRTFYKLRTNNEKLYSSYNGSVSPFHAFPENQAMLVLPTL